MSRTVHILRFYTDNQLFIERTRLRKDTVCCVLLAMGTKHKELSAKLINDFNEKKGIQKGSDFHKGLTVPRLRILAALIAQKEGYNILPSLSHQVIVNKTPERFQKKFRGLLTEGLWMVGVVIQDSLCEDPLVNCGNPFGFEQGDLAFWWAGVVIMDWLKYTAKPPVPDKEAITCLDFYLDPCLSRKHKYWQDSALSSLDRIPMQFLSAPDSENFTQTISNVKLLGHCMPEGLLALLEELRCN